MTDVVLASTKTLRTLADGGMTVTLDIAPEHFEAAFRLFGKAGSVVGVAAITGDAARAATIQAAVKKAPAETGDFETFTRAKQAGILCDKDAFMAFLTDHFKDHLGGIPVVDTDGAANVVRWHCKVISRRDLDDPHGDKGLLWDGLRNEYWAWQHGMRP